ncbi:hypothetical protein RSAG8_11165, partial [Rhizoctonia solani AG-8 WAC10335]
MLRSVIFHLFATTLTLSVIVWGAPVETGKGLVARGGTCLIDCTAGTETFGISTVLHSNFQRKLKTLDDCYTAGTDPTNVMNDITALVNNAGSSIRDLPTDLTGQFNGKAPDIVNLWTTILTDLVEHFGKWNHKSNLNPRSFGDIFKSLSQQVGAALTAAQGEINGVLSSLQALVSNLWVGYLTYPVIF